MADISTELTTIENAKYGVDVRQAIHDGLQKINEDYETGNVNANTCVTGGTLSYYKVGKIVFIRGYSLTVEKTTSFTSGAWTRLGQLAENCRPDTTWNNAIASPYKTQQLYVQVENDGVIYINYTFGSNETELSGIRFEISFPIP